MKHENRYSPYMPVRMKDIAADLGLSVVTISKVLRNHPDIAEDTRERVLKRMQEVDYQPNIMARSLVTGRSYLIGLIVPDLLHPFFAELAKALSAAIGRHGYSAIISSSEELRRSWPRRRLTPGIDSPSGPWHATQLAA